MPTILISLERLIINCTTLAGQEHDSAWREFFKRYKQLIFFFVERSCNQWDLARLKLQKRDVVDDILSEVLASLIKDLKNFKNLDSEKKFYAWLQVICNRTTSSYLKRNFKKCFSELDIMDIPQLKKGHSDIVQWELYEFIVETLREELPRGMKNMERDINIFLLNIWFGFSPKSIIEHPCYNQMSLNSVELIISRIKKNITIL